MKNTIKLLGIIAIIALIGLSFIGCDTGGDSPAPAPGPSGSPPSQKTVYTWDDADSNSYKLEITEASNSRAAYTPKSGDTYVLTITLKAGGTKISIGAVTVSNSTSITLTSAGASEPFTITVTATALVIGMGGTITFTDNSTKTVEQTSVTPVKVFDTFDLKAVYYGTEEEVAQGKGQSWRTVYPLSDFTDHTPKKGDKFTFKLSGTTTKDMEEFRITIYQDTGGLGIQPYAYKAIGVPKDWATVKLPRTFDNQEIVVFINEDTNPDRSQRNPPFINIENETTIPGSIPKGETVASIRNFRVSIEITEE